ncbi:MAG: hypothetical protein WBQ89_27925 [Candidatus Acidiferrum sp.]|jgi:hypothetical protein
MSDVFAIVAWAIIAVSAATIVVSLAHNLHRHRRESVVRFHG